MKRSLLRFDPEPVNQTDMIASLLAILISIPFIAISLLAFNLWKLVRMIRDRIEAAGYFAR